MTTHTRHAGRSARRVFAAAVLFGEAFTVLFGTLVAQGLVAAGPATGPLAAGRGTIWAGGLALVALLVVAAGLLRGRLGVPLGWALQAAILATALVLPLMLVVGVLFVAAWVFGLVVGGRLDRESRAREDRAREADDRERAGS